jgi:pilus assembly protein CpaE
MPQAPRDPAAQDETPLTVALLGPNEEHRKAVALALSAYPNLQLHEFSTFPPNVERLHQRLAQQHDIVIIDADAEPDRALALAEGLGTSGHTYLMAYSVRVDMRLAVRLMRAGAREFLTLPLDPIELAAALRRASAHREAPSQEAGPAGRVFVFLGTKGGCGVTTLASNFALALAQESNRNTLLIDLGLPLGDVAINLGMVNEYSVATALQYPNRLDANMLSSIVVKHRSGLSVLAAPGELEEKQPAKEAIDELLAVSRQSFDYVVIDAGSRVDMMLSALFDVSSTVYLVAQVGISEMRNANRIISKYFTTRDKDLQIVLNRYKPSDLLFDETQITKALTRPAQWKVPDDYAAARRTRETATPMVMGDSSVAQTIRQMAKTAAGLLPEKNGKKGFFRFLR